MKQVNLSRTEYSLLMLIRRVRLPPRAVAVLIADHFRRHKNYERLEIARIYQDSMESIEREERRVRENVWHKNGSAENFEKDG